MSDGHDQFDMQLEEMVSTMIEYGQDPTEVRRIYIFVKGIMRSEEQIDGYSQDGRLVVWPVVILRSGDYCARSSTF